MKILWIAVLTIFIIIGSSTTSRAIDMRWEIKCIGEVNYIVIAANHGVTMSVQYDRWGGIVSCPKLITPNKNISQQGEVLRPAIKDLPNN